MRKNDFWNGDTYAIVKAFKANGNRPGLIQQWKDAVEAWALSPEYTRTQEAQAVRVWLPLWQVRPFYSASELVPLWPLLALAVGWSDMPPAQKSGMRLQHELDYAGLPSFMWGGEKYYIVERVHYWKEQVAQGKWQEINHAFNG